MNTHIFVKGNQNSWDFLSHLKLNEKVILRDGRTNAYRMAHKRGIRISIRSLPDGDYELERIA